MSLRFTAILLSLTACDGGDTDTTDSGDDTGAGEVREFSYFVNTTTAYTGDTTCFGTDLGMVDPAKQGNATYNGEVHDFQTEDEVPEADISFWFADDISGTADAELVSGDNGEFTTTVPMCTPIAYGTFTDPLLELTVDTYEVHQVYPYEDDGVIDGEWINSVSTVTSKLIPGIIGIEWDTTTGIIAGTAYDCNEDPIGHAQIYIHDAAGNAPATGEVFYFDSNDLPTEKASQPDANEANGLWVAVNIPVGTWTAEMWVWNGTEHQLLGSTQLDIKAGSVNISNIYTGNDDGIVYPDTCLMAM